MKEKSAATLQLDRRRFLEISCLGVGGALASGVICSAMAQSRNAMGADDASAPIAAMLVHPNMVLLDLVGPLTVLKILGADIHLVWKQKAPVSTDVGLPVQPTADFSECPKDVDVLFVPGGTVGTTQCMDDAQVMDFLADRGERARYVTSVCTGSLTLAAAGLLQGYKATSHWALIDFLPLMGAEISRERVVYDRNRITGGGVTAGIDFGLKLAETLADEETARRIQLILEYSPEPPYENGTPEEAGPERLAIARARRKGMDANAFEAAKRAGKRLGIRS